MFPEQIVTLQLQETVGELARVGSGDFRHTGLGIIVTDTRGRQCPVIRQKSSDYGVVPLLRRWKVEPA
jgi:hypothetical protein